MTSVCGIAMVRDEADIIEYVLVHMAEQVDHLIVMDNRSTDGTRDILADLRHDLPLTVLIDNTIGYWQSDKMTELARQAYDRRYKWVVPFDADEAWYSPHHHRLADVLETNVSAEFLFASATLLNHMPTGLDPADEPNPLARISWRLRERGALPKIACRTSESLVIDMGNHSASSVAHGRVSSAGTPPTMPDLLEIRHFTWRSPDQYVRKIRNGVEAYKATTLSDDVGAHWRQWETRPDDAIRAWFDTWGYCANPVSDGRLVYDACPGWPTRSSSATGFSGSTPRS